MKKLIVLLLILTCQVSLGAQRTGLESFVRKVVTAGTKVPLMPYPKSTRFLTVRNRGTTAGHIFIGGAQSTGGPAGYMIPASTAVEIPTIDGEWSLEKIYVDADISGSEVEILYAETYD